MARMLAGLAVLLLALLGAPPAARSDALTGGQNTAAASTVTMSLGSGVVGRLASVQRKLNDAISTDFRELRDHQSPTAFLLILGLAFLYGVLHAVGPGHGKAVVASYFVANRAHWTRGIAMGSLISLIQGVSAIALVGLLAVVLQWRQFDVLDRSTLVEFVSYGLIAAVGATMLYRSATGRGHTHDHDHHGHRSTALDRRLIVATGLTPCASAIIILLFSLANDALPVGVIAVVSLSLGMAITVSAVGLASVLGRQTIVRLLDGIGVQSHRFERGLALAGAVTIVSMSGLMMLGAWARL